jgi:hypothetical protein
VVSVTLLAAAAAAVVVVVVHDEEWTRQKTSTSCFGKIMVFLMDALSSSWSSSSHGGNARVDKDSTREGYRRDCLSFCWMMHGMAKIDDVGIDIR